MIVDHTKHEFDNCPECKGLCLIIGGMAPDRAQAFQIIEAAEYILQNPDLEIRLSQKDWRGIAKARRRVA